MSIVAVSPRRNDPTSTRRQLPTKERGAVAFIVLFETLPVTGGIQTPLLLKRAAGDRGLRAVERAALLIGQPVQPDAPRYWWLASVTPVSVIDSIRQEISLISFAVP